MKQFPWTTENIVSTGKPAKFWQGLSLTFSTSILYRQTNWQKDRFDNPIL